MSKLGRNDPCHCGSGKKYKNCHGGSSSVGNRALLIGGAVVALAVAIWFGKGVVGGGDEPAPPGSAPPGKVWSAEHGHWHDAPAGGGQTGSRPVPVATGATDSLGIPGLSTSPTGTSAPPGEAPPGKIWSAEHGHWHDDTPDQAGTAQPPGEPPPGKVWSAEHGHWHDAPVVTPADSLPAAP